MNMILIVQCFCLSTLNKVKYTYTLYNNIITLRLIINSVQNNILTTQINLIILYFLTIVTFICFFQYLIHNYETSYVSKRRIFIRIDNYFDEISEHKNKSFSMHFIQSI